VYIDYVTRGGVDGSRSAYTRRGKTHQPGRGKPLSNYETAVYFATKHHVKQRASTLNVAHEGILTGFLGTIDW